MNVRSPYLTATLVVLLMGSGVWLWRQHQELEAWKARAQSAEVASARNIAERMALEKTTSDSREQTAALEKKLDEAHAALIAKPSAEPGVAPSADAKISVATVKQWLADANDPAVIRRMSTQAHNQTVRRYAPLFTQLNLSAEQTDAFTKLLTDKRQTPMDIVVASLQAGTDPAANMDGFRSQVIESRAAIENQIQALLGDPAYAQYQAFDQNAAHAGVINNLQTSLLGTAEPLTPDQITRLNQVLQATGATHVTDPVIAGAQQFLSPTQLQALQDLRAIQQANSLKRSQAGQALPTMPPAPATKNGGPP